MCWHKSFSFKISQSWKPCEFVSYWNRKTPLKKKKSAVEKYPKNICATIICVQELANLPSAYVHYPLSFLVHRISREESTNPGQLDYYLLIKCEVGEDDSRLHGKLSHFCIWQIFKRGAHVVLGGTSGTFLAIWAPWAQILNHCNFSIEQLQGKWCFPMSTKQCAQLRWVQLCTQVSAKFEVEIYNMLDTFLI